MAIHLYSMMLVIEQRAGDGQEHAEFASSNAASSGGGRAHPH